MTIPANVFLPTPPTATAQVPDYLRRLNVSLQNQYGQLANSINAGLGVLNLDGGTPDTVYTASQVLDGGGV